MRISNHVLGKGCPICAGNWRSSGRKVWWYYSFDDPKTGRHFDFEWQAKIIKRKNSLECPYLCGNTLTTGVNDLRTMYPEIAAQWHPLKNGNLTPETVAAHSDRNVWWFLSYDDPKSGKHFDFEWEDSISSRTSLGHGCPYLNGRRIWIGFNDLETCFPEIAAQWHPTRNGTLTPDEVTVSSNQRVWWYYPYDDPETSEHFDFEWQDTVNNRTSFLDRRCPFLTGRMVWKGFNDLQTRYPEIAAQWHPEYNQGRKPSEVKYNSSDLAWWKMPYDDAITGKHFDFEWECPISYKVMKGPGWCPFIEGNRVYTGYNDLQTRYPEIAAQWHPEYNQGRKPSEVKYNSSDLAWWKMPYDDAVTGKHFEFEWVEPISYRVEKGPNTCPILSGKKVWAGFNDLETVYPTLAKEYNTPLNHGVSPSKIRSCSNQKVWWMCTSCGHTWRMSINYRVKFGGGCPNCLKNRTYR